MVWGDRILGGPSKTGWWQYFHGSSFHENKPHTGDRWAAVAYAKDPRTTSNPAPSPDQPPPPPRPAMTGPDLPSRGHPRPRSKRPNLVEIFFRVATFAAAFTTAGLGEAATLRYRYSTLKSDTDPQLVVSDFSDPRKEAWARDLINYIASNHKRLSPNYSCFSHLADKPA